MKIRNCLTIWLSSIILSLIVSLTFPVKLWAQTQALCENRGYVVGFFNGVWNSPTPDSAYESLAALRSLLGDTFNNEPIEYELFYNHTGKTVDATFLQDIAETFIQRANELDQSGNLSLRFEYLWAVLTDGNQSLWDRLIETVPASGGVLEALYTDFTTKVVAGYAKLLSNPPTQADRAEHSARLDELALQGQKLLLVAHSQGNLFVNNAFDYITQKVDANSVKVVHIAPASLTLRGTYTLANIDVVINALRFQGAGSVLETNLTIPASLRDLSGHKFIDTYLDGSRAGRSTVIGLIASGLSGLVTPVADASIGFFTITLTWDGFGDVDLHTFEPNGTHVFYAMPMGTGGILDVDNVTANGPEHYFSTCDVNVLKLGTYQVSINNFEGATGRTATVQAASVRTGVLATRMLDVGPERGSDGDNSPTPVFQVVVSQDENDEYHVTVQ